MRAMNIPVGGERSAVSGPCTLLRSLLTARARPRPNRAHGALLQPHLPHGLRLCSGLGIQAALP